MADNFSESEGRYKQTEASVNLPKVFDLSDIKEPQVLVPSTVVDEARKARLEAKYPSYSPVFIDFNEFLGKDSTEEDRKWAENNPQYEISAIDGRIYVRDTSMKDPKYPHATVQVLRIDYDPDSASVLRMWRDSSPKIFTRAIASFPDNSIMGRIKNIFGIVESDGEHVDNRESESSKEIIINNGNVTNESLDAIFLALNPGSEDKVLAVSGFAGCVPFALALGGAKVDAVDIEPKNIEIAEQQAKLVEEGKFDAFLARNKVGFEVESEMRARFFSRGVQYNKIGLNFDGELGRVASQYQQVGGSLYDVAGLFPNKEADYSDSKIKILQGNIGNISFRSENILEALKSGKYSKIYLSNIIGFNEDQNYDFTVKLFKALVDSLLPGGLLYSTSGPMTDSFLERAIKEGQIPNDLFELEPLSTGVASYYEEQAPEKLNGHKKRPYNWAPHVYRKK